MSIIPISVKENTNPHNSKMYLGALIVLAIEIKRGRKIRDQRIVFASMFRGVKSDLHFGFLAIHLVKVTCHMSHAYAFGY